MLRSRIERSLVVTLFVAGCAFVVTGMWLFSRWIVRALAAPEFFGSYKAIGLIAEALESPPDGVSDASRNQIHLLLAWCV